MDTEYSDQLTIADVQKLLGMSRRTVERAIRTGKFPPSSTAPGKGRPRQWLRGDVLAYAARIVK